MKQETNSSRHMREGIMGDKLLVEKLKKITKGGWVLVMD